VRERETPDGSARRVPAAGASFGVASAAHPKSEEIEQAEHPSLASRPVSGRQIVQ